MSLDKYDLAYITKMTFENIVSGYIKEMTVSDMIIDINRDRSSDWIPYTIDNWEEGLNKFTEWRIVK